MKKIGGADSVGAQMCCQSASPSASQRISPLGCLDGLAGGGTFFGSSFIGMYTADGAQGTTTFCNGSFLLYQATLGPAAVPEPSSIALIALGVTALGVARRQRSRRQNA